MPPIRATRSEEIDCPRPVPPYCRVVELSDWVNASKISFCLSGGIADASVGHAEVKDGLVSNVSLQFNPHNDFSLGGEFERVSDQMHDDLPQPLWVSVATNPAMPIDAARIPATVITNKYRTTSRCRRKPKSMCSGPRSR